MGEIPTLVKIAVALKIQPNDGPVYFKVDGQRFGQNRTIKLLTGAKYKIEVVLKPGALRATTMNIGGIILPLEEKSRDPHSVSYTAFYDTEGLANTKSGERQPLQVIIQIMNTNTVEVIICIMFFFLWPALEYGLVNLHQVIYVGLDFCNYDTHLNFNWITYVEY